MEMTIKLPENCVDINSEDMEYLDGGATRVNYWWGWAANLNAKECGEVANILDFNLYGAGGMGAISGALCAAFPAAGIGALCASVVYGLGVQYVKTELQGCAWRGRGATLCKNLSGYHVYPY